MMIKKLKVKAVRRSTHAYILSGKVGFSLLGLANQENGDGRQVHIVMKTKPHLFPTQARTVVIYFGHAHLFLC